MTEITSVEELDELVGRPGPAAANKVRTVLDELDREWLDRSPLCLIATADAHGACDVSPKGDPPGFTLVLDGTTIAIPDRPGNRRVDGFRNVLANPQVGLLHLIPGRGDTLRINGRARLVSDAPFFDRMVVRGNRPRLALVVDVEEVFYHCAKAFMRSQLWEPQSWEPEAVPSRARISKSLERRGDSLEQLERHYGPEYAQGLYSAQ
jgi:PPOX class probable FMN-dependent enzyme